MADYEPLTVTRDVSVKYAPPPALRLQLFQTRRQHRDQRHKLGLMQL